MKTRIRRYRVRPRRRVRERAWPARRVLPALLFLIPVAGIAAFIWITIKEPDLSVDSNLCLINLPLEAHTLVLIDRSDPLTEGQKQSISTIIGEIIGRLQPFEKFTVRTIDSTFGTQAGILFSKCRPGVVTPLYQTPQKVEETVEREFLTLIARKIEELKTDTTSRQSPIIESLSYATLLDDFSPRLSRRSVVIFSDMVQNTTYSHYSDREVDYSNFEGTDYYRNLDLNLKDVNIRVYYILRPELPHIQGPAHVRWWVNFFDDQGAGLTIEELGSVNAN